MSNEQISPDLKHYLSLLEMMCSDDPEKKNQGNKEIMLKRRNSPLFIISLAAQVLTYPVEPVTQLTNIFLLRYCILPRFDTPVEYVARTWSSPKNRAMAVHIKNSILGWVASENLSIQRAAAACLAAVFNVEHVQFTWPELFPFIESQMSQQQLDLKKRYGLLTIISEIYAILPGGVRMETPSKAGVSPSTFESILHYLFLNFTLPDLNEPFIEMNVECVCLILKQIYKSVIKEKDETNGFECIKALVNSFTSVALRLTLKAFESVCEIFIYITSILKEIPFFPAIHQFMLNALNNYKDDRLEPAISFWSNLYAEEKKAKKEKPDSIVKSASTIVPILLQICTFPDFYDLFDTIESALRAFYESSPDTMLENCKDYINKFIDVKTFSALVLLSSISHTWSYHDSELFIPTIKEYAYKYCQSETPAISKAAIHVLKVLYSSYPQFQDYQAEYDTIFGIINQNLENPEFLVEFLPLISALNTHARPPKRSNQLQNAANLCFHIINSNMMNALHQENAPLEMLRSFFVSQRISLTSNVKPVVYSILKRLLDLYKSLINPFLAAPPYFKIETVELINFAIVQLIQMEKENFPYDTIIPFIRSNMSDAENFSICFNVFCKLLTTIIVNFPSMFHKDIDLVQSFFSHAMETNDLNVIGPAMLLFGDACKYLPPDNPSDVQNFVQSMFSLITNNPDPIIEKITPFFLESVGNVVIGLKRQIPANMYTQFYQILMVQTLLPIPVMNEERSETLSRICACACGWTAVYTTEKCGDGKLRTSPGMKFFRDTIKVWIQRIAKYEKYDFTFVLIFKNLLKSIANNLGPPVLTLLNGKYVMDILRNPAVNQLPEEKEENERFIEWLRTYKPSTGL